MEARGDRAAAVAPVAAALGISVWQGRLKPAEKIDVRFVDLGDVERIACASPGSTDFSIGSSGRRQPATELDRAVNVLVYLVPMALALKLAGLAAFLWALRSGQYDDIEGAAVRILDDGDIDPAA